MNLRLICLFLCLSLFTACSSVLKDKPGSIFGNSEDIAYANDLWKALDRVNLVGEELKPVDPIVGAAPPHGWILEILDQNLTVNGHRGFVIVKRNYDNNKLTINAVKADRKSNLSSLTVMYQREPDYDLDNKNWFWVKYYPDGELFTKLVNGRNVAIAGRVKKGLTPEDNGGCIYCHRSAGGGDYIFYPDIQILPVD